MSAFDILTARGVTRLCHFTLLKNLTHIISSENGILASDSIRYDTKTVNDSKRYDGKPNYVCNSVEYPNSWFLNNATDNNSDKIFKDWVVLYIDLRILNIKKAKFCPCNAAKGKGRYIEDNLENISSIFNSNVLNYNRTSNMISACPTNGQAEILIKDNIPREYIVGIAVGNEDIAKRVYAMLTMYSINNIPIYIAPDVLTTRWSTMVRNGHRPNEIRCNWSEES